MVKGCGKSLLNVLGYLIRQDTDTLWEAQPNGWVWRSNVICGDPDSSGALDLTILCAECCKQLGYLW